MKTGDVDPVLATGLQRLAHEAEARWSGSFVVERRAFVSI